MGFAVLFSIVKGESSGAEVAISAKHALLLINRRGLEDQLQIQQGIYAKKILFREFPDIYVSFDCKVYVNKTKNILVGFWSE